ncbi:MAG: zinc-binding alcohol dehydrogenase family protein [Gammaproteobacteria bacterium]|nr:zinc-binding alcohol dehydrogenase family protein [Gammaproteobacteria bacterium]
MTISTYWYFDEFGPAKTVLKQGRQTLPPLLPGQALVAIRAIGLNRADYQYVLGKHFPPRALPACVSQEACGVIVELGPEPTDPKSRRHWRIGDRVAFAPMRVDMGGMGVLRDRGVYDQSSLLAIPDGFSDRQAAAYWMGILTMAGAMEMAGIGPKNSRGQSIVVTAATGGVATMGLRLAQAWGAETVAITRSQEKAEWLAALADHVVVADSASSFRARLRSLFPNGVDVVIDPLGGEYVGASVEALSFDGHYVGYEMVTRSSGTFDIPSLLQAGAHLHGYTVFRLLQQPGLMDRMLEIGMKYAPQAKPILAENYGFDAAPDAYAALNRCQHFGKITIAL